MRAKVHPFYRLSDAGHVGFESDVSVELNFASVSPSSENDGGNIKVLVLGGMETNFYFGPGKNQRSRWLGPTNIPNVTKTDNKY